MWNPLRNAAEPVTEWFINELKNQGYEDAEDLVHISQIMQRKQQVQKAMEAQLLIR